MNVAIILAGGSGTRFGAEMPKQYIEVLGKPVLAYVLEGFQASPDTDAIAIVCQPEFNETVSGIVRKYGIDKLRWIIPGGESCPISIQKGVFGLRSALAPEDSILLHMSVSPLISAEDIASALHVCHERGCCFTMHPVNICMARRTCSNWAEENAPKEQFIELNTPWAFRYGEILDLYDRLEQSGYVLGEADYTLGLWLADGRRAYYSPGNPPGRLKITTLHDMDLFEGYLMLRQKRDKQGGKP